MFLVDWFTFTSHCDSLKSIIDLLGLQNIQFETVKGNNGYADCLLFGKLRINYCGHLDNMGINVDMSGTGCRTFETYTKTSFKELFDYLIDNPKDYNITRLDVAFDDKQEIIPLRKLQFDTIEKNFVSKFDFFDVRFTSKGSIVYQGSPQSDIRFRFYDKAAERKIEGHWVRAEMQLRRELSYEFIKQYISGVPLGDLFCGVLHNYLRYINPNSNPRKDRCKMRPYWKKLINNAVKVKIFTPCNLEYNLENLANFVVKQAGGAVDTYLKILGYEHLENALEERKTPLNPKYKTLLSEAKQVEFLNGVGDLI